MPKKYSPSRQKQQLTLKSMLRGQFFLKINTNAKRQVMHTWCNYYPLDNVYKTGRQQNSNLSCLRMQFQHLSSGKQWTAQERQNLVDASADRDTRGTSLHNWVWKMLAMHNTWLTGWRQNMRIKLKEVEEIKERLGFSLINP